MTSDAARPVKVAHIITKWAVGGAQESVLATCAGLSRRRFDQTVLSGSDVDAEGSLLDIAAERRVTVRTMPSLVRPLRPWQDLLALAELVRWLRAERPDLVHTHSSKAGFLGRGAAWIVGIPAVHSVHGWSFHDGMHPALRCAVVGAERVAARASRCLVVEAATDRGKGLDAGIGAPSRYRLIRNGIDVASFGPDPASGATIRAELGIPAGSPLVGTIGRLAEQKHPLLMVDAMAGVIRDRPSARFLWVGDGPLRAAAEQRVARLGLDDRFLFVGVRHDVAAILSALDVFALSSRWEGLPRTVAEAMAAQVPVVATAVDGCTEIIAHGDTGLLVPAADARALTEAIVRLLGDAESAKAMADRAAARIAAWDQPLMLEALSALYVEVSDGGATAKRRGTRRSARSPMLT